MPRATWSDQPAQMRQPTRHKRRVLLLGAFSGSERRIPRKRVQNQISDADSEQPERIPVTTKCLSRDTSARSRPLGGAGDLGESPIPRVLITVAARQPGTPPVPTSPTFTCGQGGKGSPIFCHFYLGSPVEAPCPAMLLDGYLLSCCFVCRLRRDNTADWSRGNRVVMIRPDTRPRARPDPVSQDE